MNKKKYPFVNISEIKFYRFNENGDELTNKNGTLKEFILKDGVRFKPLEYLCEDLSPSLLEPVLNKESV